MSNYGTMSLASSNDAIITGTVFNDLVLYHKNPSNHVVVGIQGSSNSLIMSSSGCTINGPISCSHGISPTIAYPYGVFVGSGGGGNGTFAPLVGSLTVLRNGISCTDGMTICVPCPGTYFCTLGYSNISGTIVAIADGASPSTCDYGCSIMETGGKSGQATMMINISDHVQILTNFTAISNQTFAIRRIY